MKVYIWICVNREEEREASVLVSNASHQLVRVLFGASVRGVWRGAIKSHRVTLTPGTVSFLHLGVEHKEWALPRQMIVKTSFGALMMTMCSGETGTTTAWAWASFSQHTCCVDPGREKLSFWGPAEDSSPRVACGRFAAPINRHHQPARWATYPSRHKKKKKDLLASTSWEIYIFFYYWLICRVFVESLKCENCPSDSSRGRSDTLTRLVNSLTCLPLLNITVKYVSQEKKKKISILVGGATCWK